jgi:hypothetical protein
MRVGAEMPLALGKQFSAREKVLVFQGMEALDVRKSAEN